MLRGQRCLQAPAFPPHCHVKGCCPPAHAAPCLLILLCDSPSEWSRGAPRDMKPTGASKNLPSSLAGRRGARRGHVLACSHPSGCSTAALLGGRRRRRREPQGLKRGTTEGLHNADDRQAKSLLKEEKSKLCSSADSILPYS